MKIIDRNIYILDELGDLWPTNILLDNPNFFHTLCNRYKIERGYDSLGKPWPKEISDRFLSVKFSIDGYRKAQDLCTKLNETWIIECVEAGRIDKEKYWTELDHKYYNELKGKYEKDSTPR